MKYRTKTNYNNTVVGLTTLVGSYNILVVLKIKEDKSACLSLEFLEKSSTKYSDLEILTIRAQFALLFNIIQYSKIKTRITYFLKKN